MENWMLYEILNSEQSSKKNYTDSDLVPRGTLIATILDKSFYYGGWNEHGWHLIYTDDENFHASQDLDIHEFQIECERIYVNYYA